MIFIIIVETIIIIFLLLVLDNICNKIENIIEDFEKIKKKREWKNK